MFLHILFNVLDNCFYLMCNKKIQKYMQSTTFLSDMFQFPTKTKKESFFFNDIQTNFILGHLVISFSPYARVSSEGNVYVMTRTKTCYKQQTQQEFSQKWKNRWFWKFYYLIIIIHLVSKVNKKTSLHQFVFLINQE